MIAIDVALDEIAHLLRENPIDNPILTIEPRGISPDKPVRWDIQLWPNNLAIEAKRKLTKSDIDEFLKNARKTISTGCDQKNQLIYSEPGAIKTLEAVQKLSRLACEAGQDHERFVSLCNLESSKRLDEICETLSPYTFSVARSIELHHSPEHLIQKQIQFKLCYLVTPGQSEQLFNGLFTRFVRAMKHREGFYVLTIIKDLQSAGVSFSDPATVIPQNIHPVLYNAIYFLQHCKYGVPTEILQAVCKTGSESELHEQLSCTQALIKQEDLWSVNPLPAKIDHEQDSAVLGVGLEATLEFIRSNKQSPRVYEQVDNAIVLTRCCKDVNPGIVIQTFSRIDKLLKRRGRKRDVLEMASVVVECAKMLNRAIRRC